MDAANLGAQVIELLVIAIPIASVTWTITHEEIFREPREFCARCSQECRQLALRKFFYLFTCEYCFSHYVAALFLFITGFKLIFNDWRGYMLSLFALVWIANTYMSIFGRVRLDIKRERVEIKGVEHEVRQKTENGQQERPKAA
jgi:hypothetical protein